MHLVGEIVGRQSRRARRYFSGDAKGRLSGNIGRLCADRGQAPNCVADMLMLCGAVLPLTDAMPCAEEGESSAAVGAARRRLGSISI